MFEKILSGQKSFDVRIADFKVKEGDILVLEEYDPKIQKYTGRKIEKKVNFVLKTKGQKFWSQNDIDKYGFLVISF